MQLGASNYQPSEVSKPKQSVVHQSQDNDAFEDLADCIAKPSESQVTGDTAPKFDRKYVITKSMTNLNVQTELNFKTVSAKVSFLELKKGQNFILQKDVISWRVQTEVSGERSDLVCARQSEDFLSLRQILHQQYPYIMVPYLPSKLDYKEDRIEEQRRYLEKFLSATLQSEILKSCKLVCHFLKLDRA